MIWFLFKCLLGMIVMMGNSILDCQRLFKVRCYDGAKTILNQVHRCEVMLYLILLWNSVLVTDVISQQRKRKDMRSCIPLAIGIVYSMEVGLSLAQSLFSLLLQLLKKKATMVNFTPHTCVYYGFHLPLWLLYYKWLWYLGQMAF